VEDVVQTVDFETYAKVVMAAEWNPLWHIEALKAGAVAVKEYAWYYTMHWRGGSGSNGCYDVIDNTNDQIYSPGVYTPAASHIQAVEDTWLESVARGGDLFPTGYRTGHDVSCGRDADGAHMFQYSALECALAGKTAEQILLIYYANAVIQGAPTLPGAPADVSAVGYDKSAQVSWSAPTFNGNSAITGYTVTSTPGGKTCTTGGALSCAVSGLNNGTSYRFTVTATNSVGTGPASDYSNKVTPAVVAGASYHPMTPARLLDTRYGNGLSVKLSANTPATFQVTGRAGIPSGATAVTGNVTVVNPTFSWAIYLGPEPTPFPTTSTLNFLTGEAKANGVTLALGSGGTLSATYMSAAGNTTDLVFDVTGYYTPDTTGATYHPMAAARLVDSRKGTGLSTRLSANKPATFQVTGRFGIPTTATAVTGNVTVVNATFSWAIYLGPDPNPKPTTSTLNFLKGEAKANGVTVALGSGGTLSATYISYSGNTTDLVFDVTGYFTNDLTGARYVPITPVRLLDTRYHNGLSTRLSANTPATFQVAGRDAIPSNATAVTGNVTVVYPTDSWAIYLGPDPLTSPGSSTLNFLAGDVKANGVTVALGSGGTLSATYISYSGNTTDLIFDATGYYEP
jgi:hypothetical protein